MRTTSGIAGSLIAVLVLGGGVLPASTQAATASPGLFGTQNPVADGTFRQSFALLGLASVGIDAPEEAVMWLVEQQCPDGSFVAFRADTSEPCPEPDPENYSGPDTNSTALAALALAAHGERKAALKAVAWLKLSQLPGGGWGFVSGLAPDTNSTGLALAALGADPGARQESAAARRWLHRQVLPCTAPVGERFGMTWQRGPDALANGSATTQGLLGLADAFPVRERAQRQGAPAVDCAGQGKPVDPTRAATRWLATTILDNNGAIPDAYAEGQADLSSTALAVVGLVATRTSGRATTAALATLQREAPGYITDGTADRPAALGILLLAAEATGSDPEDFGGIDLPERLLATLQD